MRALITGFEPYGGRGVNPAGEIAVALDGRTIGGVSVAGRRLPVSFARLRGEIDALLDEVRPDLVISLGLWPGEPMIRLERLGTNIADFEIGDNDGVQLRDQPVAEGGPAALMATLPLRDILRALLAAGIPARLSSTAGTFLCNVTLYSFLAAIEARGSAARCGFIHVPYMPEQVAGLLGATERERRLEQHQRADLASMELATMVRAVETAIAVCAEGGRG
jgi:pyroglutamyl-peptidase